ARRRLPEYFCARALSGQGTSTMLPRRRTTVRRRRPARMTGGGFMDFIKKVATVAKKVNDFAKDTKIASKGLAAIGQKDLAAKAASAGYGRRRRVRRVRRV
ncbi:MAG: hypothetical protein KGL39_60395, partial [Patescibacteria group bacterium]|nr:hypothetical protein [Patescibacteria group bacterium]